MLTVCDRWYTYKAIRSCSQPDLIRSKDTGWGSYEIFTCGKDCCAVDLRRLRNSKTFSRCCSERQGPFPQVWLVALLSLGCREAFSRLRLMLLQSLVPAPNIDQRFAIISAAYAEFCRSNGMTRIIGKIDQYLCGFTLPEPQGTWNKAAFTSNICLFVEDYLSRHQEMTRGHQRLQHFVTLFDRALHRCDCFNLMLTLFTVICMCYMGLLSCKYHVVPRFLLLVVIYI